MSATSYLCDVFAQLARVSFHFRFFSQSITTFLGRCGRAQFPCTQSLIVAVSTSNIMNLRICFWALFINLTGKCQIQPRFILVTVVGEKEQAAQTVNVRTRDNVVHGELNIPDLIAKFQNLSDKKTSEDNF